MLQQAQRSAIGRKSILVLSEDPAWRRLLVNLLESPRRSVGEAASSVEALAALDARGPCSLILSDIELRDRSGLETLREIKRLHPEVPVVFLSENTDIDLYLTVMDEGAFDYLPTPVQLADLLRVIGRALAVPARQPEYSVV